MVPFGLIAVVMSTVNEYFRLVPAQERNTTAATESADEVEREADRERLSRLEFWRVHGYPLLDEYGDREFRPRNERKFTLMVLISGNGTDFQDFWNGGEANDVDGKALWPLDQIIVDGNFKSRIVDQWSYPEFGIFEASVLGLSTMGDVLWRTDFNATDTGFSLTSWCAASKFLDSSATPVPAPTIRLWDDNKNYDTRMMPTSDDTRAWFTITTNQLPDYGPLPLFYAARRPASPFLFPTLKTGYLGCWEETVFTNLTLIDIANVGTAPTTCLNHCGSFQAAYIRFPSKCYCGLYDTEGTETGQCSISCTGDPTSFCGTFVGTQGSVYHKQDGRNPLPTQVTELLSLRHTFNVGSVLAIELKNHFDPTTEMPLFITHLKLHAPDPAIPAGAREYFSFRYSPLPCQNNTAADWKMYHQQNDHHLQIGDDMVDVKILKVQCVKFNISIDSAIVNITFYGPIDSMEHIELPVVAIQAKRTIPDTTTVSSTTTSTSTTIPTTTTTVSTSTLQAPTSSSSTTDPTTSPSSSITTSSTQPFTSSTQSSTQSPATTSTSQSPATTSTSSTSLTTSNSSSATTHAASDTTPSETSTADTITTPDSSCNCPCNNYSQALNLTAEELEAKILSIQKKLAVNVSSLSSTIRKLTSAEDNRPSAMSIGYLGISLIVGIGAMIFLIDASSLVRDFKKLKENIKQGLYPNKPEDD